jgi:hypothetical protein
MNQNRVETELAKWLEMEARIGKLFSNAPSASRVVLQQKLLKYNLVLSKYKATANMSERYTLAIINKERRDIEKQLYPNFLLRLFRRLFIVPLATSKIAKVEVKSEELNTHALQETLQRMGFPDLMEKVQEKINQGQSQFTVPVSHFMNDRIRMDYKVAIINDGNGGYQVRGFEASLHDSRKPMDIKARFFEQGQSNGIDNVQAYHLLAGRSLERNGKWSQLDFTDRDENGNYVLKDYRTGPEYDLKEKLELLPIKDLGFDGKLKLVEGLKAGERHEVTFVLDGNEKKFFIEANPQFRTVTLYDEHSKKITFNNHIKPNDLSVVRRALDMLGEKPDSKRNGKKIM